MEVRIKNFRGIEQATYSFTPGVNLIEGCSGVGKSTILNAICWAFYGKLQKISPKDSEGSTKGSEVCVKWDGFELGRRNKNPRFIRISTGNGKKRISYSGDEASAYIEQHFGCYETWLACTYMQQEDNNHFFSVGNDVRRDIINTLIYGQDDPEELVNKLDAKIKELQKTCDTQKMRIDVLREQLPPKAPKCKRSSKEILVQIEQLEQDIVKQNKKYSEYLTQLARYQDECKERVSLKQQLQQLPPQEEPCTYISLLRQLPDEESTTDEESTSDNDANDIPSILATLAKIDEQKIKAKKCSIPYDSNLIQIQETVRQWKTANDVYQNQMKSYKQERMIYDTYRRLLDEKSRLETAKPPTSAPYPPQVDPSEEYQHEYDKIRERIIELQNQLKQARLALDCPHCSKPVVLWDGKLQSCSRDTKSLQEELVELDRQCEEFRRMRQQAHNSYLQARKKYDDYCREMEIATQRGKRVREIQEQLSEYEHPMEPSIPREPPKCKYSLGCLDLVYYDYPGMTRAQCNAILEQRARRQRRNEILQQLPPKHLTLQEAEKLQERIVARDKALDYITRRLNSLISDEPTLVEAPQSDEILVQLRKELRNTEDYERYHKARQRYDDERQSYKQLHVKLAEYAELRSQTLLYYQSRLEPTLNNINQLVNQFLQPIFPHPIHFNLSSYREGQQFKQRFEFRLTHRESEFDVRELSGGERRRVSIALTFAFFYHRSHPFVMFDEPLASLDEEISRTIIEFIKQYFPDKIVLLSAHNTVKGNYDSICSLDTV